MTQKLMAALLLAVALAGCTSQSDNEKKSNQHSLHTSPTTETALVGSWIEPNPIDSTQVQGIELQTGGMAQSINMATLLYKNWSLSDQKLVLVAESIGNRTSSIDTTSYEIVKIDTDSLVLKNQELMLRYRRK